jgi:hypothetical protein
MNDAAQKDANPFGTGALQRNLLAAQNWLSKKLNSCHGPEWLVQVLEKRGEIPIQQITFDQRMTMCGLL